MAVLYFLYLIGIIITLCVFEAIRKKSTILKGVDENHVMISMTVFTFLWPIFWLIIFIETARKKLKKEKP